MFFNAQHQPGLSGEGLRENQGCAQLGVALCRMVQHGAQAQRVELRHAAAAPHTGSAGDHAATCGRVRGGSSAQPATVESRNLGLVATIECVAQSRQGGQARNGSGRGMETVRKSAEGTAPSADRRTRRESLDSPGSHCSKRERTAAAPMHEQPQPIPLHTAMPGERLTLVTAQAFVFPHGPTNDNPVEVFCDRLELRAPKATVIAYPPPNLGRHKADQIVQR
jgi:hypothetical protein